MEIDENSLEAIESLLSQSVNGFHPLFDNQRVAQILSRPTEEMDFFTTANMDKIQTLFTELIQQKSSFDKLCFLHSLSEEDYEILLRTYFHIVDNTAMAQREELH